MEFSDFCINWNQFVFEMAEEDGFWYDFYPFIFDAGDWNTPI